MRNIGNIAVTIFFLSLSITKSSLSQGTWSADSATGSNLSYGQTSAVVGDKIFLIQDNQGDNPIEMFDPVWHTWNKPMTSGEYGLREVSTSQAINDKIYVFGDTVYGGGIKVIKIFDPAQNKWTTISTTGEFTDRNRVSSSVVDGKIYVIGGIKLPNTYLNSVNVFDPISNSWSTPATTGTFTARADAAASAVNVKFT